MPLAPRLAACLLLPLLAACATAVPAGPDPRLAALVARLPAGLAEFTLQESVPNPTNPAAWTARYGHAASGTIATVGLNAPGEVAVPDGPNSPLVQEVVNSVSLLVQARTGGGGLTRMPDFGAAAAGQPPEIRCSDLQLRQAEGMIRRVLVCATGVNGGVTAISMIGQHPPEAGDIARLFMTNFALQAVRALRGTEGAAPAAAPAAGRVFRL